MGLKLFWEYSSTINLSLINIFSSLIKAMYSKKFHAFAAYDEMSINYQRRSKTLFYNIDTPLIYWLLVIIIMLLQHAIVAIGLVRVFISVQKHT